MICQPFKSLKLLAASVCVVLTVPLAEAIAHDPPASKWRVSCFAYRDTNRNGLYDMADRPYAGLEVRMVRPDGSRTRAFSNISGFANFDLGIGQYHKMDIFAVGPHQVEAVPSAGFITTSDARAQTLTFVENKNAGGGLVAENNCVPMGVAPELFVAGTVSKADLGEGVNVHLVSSGGSSAPLPLDENGVFYELLEPGKYVVRITDASTGKALERNVELTSHPVVLSTVTSLEQPSASTQPLKTVTFDDLTVSDTLYEIPSGYGGLFWWQWIATHNKFYKGNGYVNGTISSEFIAYDSSGQPGYMWTENGETFDFVGTYINVAWPLGEKAPVMVKAWRGDKLVHTDKLFLRITGSVYLSADYRGITKLEFTHPNSERIVIDNFSFRK